jgi:iron complex transport system substrate-binding protein
MILAFTMVLPSSMVLAAAPKRIASLSLAGDEILIDLAAKCGVKDRILALSVFADDPSASNVSESAKAVKSRVHSEPESLFALKPDLVIAASFNRPELLTMIRTRNLNLVYLDRFSSATDIAEHILAIGKAIGCEKESREMERIFFAELSRNQNTHSKTSKPKLRVLSYSPDLTVMGKDSLFDDLVNRAGGVNTATAMGLSRWPKIDAEMLLTSKTDAVIIMEPDSKQLRLSIKNHPIWKKLPAIKAGNLIFIDPKLALSTSHYFAKAVNDLRHKFKLAEESIKVPL